jgi:competence protein ComEC
MRSLPICLCAAIATGAALGLKVDLPALLGLGAAISLTLAAIGGVIASQPRLVLSAALAGAFLNTWTLSAATDRLARSPPLAALVERASLVEIEGELRSDAARDGEATRIVLAVTNASVDGARSEAKGDAMLTVTGRLADSLRREWRAGRRVAMPASLRRPARYLNDGVPDRQLAAARRGLILVGTVKSGALVRLIARGSWTEERAADLRAYVRDVIGRRIGALDPTAGAIATAVLIGDRTGLDAALEDRLQAAGTYHVIAISGGNIAILAITLLASTSLLRLPAGAAAILVAALLAFHAMVVGSGASVTRATAMAIAYLLLGVADLRAAPFSALAAAAAAMIALAPEIVADAGFLLTVCATGAIVLLAAHLSQTVVAPGRSALRTAVVAVVAASVATEIVLLPIAAALFGRVTAAGPVLNLVAVPAMTVLQQAGLAAVACDRWWPGLATVAGHIAAAAAYSLVESSRLVDWLPAITKRVPAPDRLVIGIYFASGAAFLAGVVMEQTPGRWRRRLGRIGGAAFALATLWILLAPHVWRWPWTADGWLTIISIDVGQGDATLIEFPDATTMLVDAGGLGGTARFDMGARVVAPAMWARRIGWLDALLVTHGDPDHIGGAPTIVDVFRPTIFEGIAVPTHLPSATLRALARARRLEVHSLYRQSQWRVGPVVVRVWHPPPPDWERRKVRNDDSLVIELQIGEVSIVLPGDVSAGVERDMADRMKRVPFRVLKAAHHGSASSSSAVFLDALRPSVALISCGRQNRFGHPAPPVLARYRERGVEVFRTDEDGEITLRTDGRAIEVATFTGRAWRRPAPIASRPAMSPRARRASFPASAGQMP